MDPGSTTFIPNAQAFSFYASVYKNRPELNCLIHIRTPPVTAVSAMKFGLLPICQEACICGPTTSHTINIDDATNGLAIDSSIRESRAKVRRKFAC